MMGIEIYKYLRRINISVSKKYIMKLIASHSDYPSLLSISDTLNFLGIPHGAIEVEKKNLVKLPPPYLLCLSGEESGFFAVENTDNIAKRPDILKTWNGVVLLIKPGVRIEDEENQINIKKENADRTAIIGVIGSIILFFSLLLIQNFNLIIFLTLTTSAIGLLLGYLINAKEIGAVYDAVEAFCGTEQKSNCDTVLKSDEAKVFGLITLSDLLWSYFMFQLIIIGFLMVLDNEITFLWILIVGGALSIPSIVYSLYIQAMKLKSWCKLCLLVDAVLLIQAVLFGWMIGSDKLVWDGINPWIVALAVLLLFGIFSILFLLKNKVEEGYQAQKAEHSAKRIKFDTSVFTQLLFQEKKVNTSSFEKEVKIGRSHTPIQILMAANLNCDSCGVSFEQVTKLINRHPDKINLSIRFLIKNNKSEIALNSERHLLNYWLKNIHNQKKETEKTVRLINDWFDLKSADKFKPGNFEEKYLIESSTKFDNGIISKILDKHRMWYKEYRIKVTPAFFINGYKLPKNYQIKDLSTMILNLERVFEITNQGKSEITS